MKKELPIHTPAPWVIAETFSQYGFTDNDGGIPIMAGTDFDRARIGTACLTRQLPRGKTYKAADPARDANARLIAAAPETAAERDRLKEINAELLATLESINRCASPGSRTVDELMRDMGLACDIARAAIARATVTP